MPEDQLPVEPPIHRRLAVDLFNHVWALLDKPERTAAENDEMLHAAHASRHHWGVVGTAINWARGEWQVSRVYAVLGRAEPARFHAQRCLDWCEADGLKDFDLAFAFEALARAERLAGNEIARAGYRLQAHAAGEQIAEADDREWFFKNLETA